MSSASSRRLRCSDPSSVEFSSGSLCCADASFQEYDKLIEPETKPPTGPLKTGSSASRLHWEELGRTGRQFISSGPTREDISAFSGRGAQARGIAQGVLKATCAALAHLSKEYDGQLAAERRQIHRSMLQQPDVMNSIADGYAATAYGLVCNALRSNRGCARRRSKRPSRASGRMTLLRDHLPPLAVAAV